MTCKQLRRMFNDVNRAEFEGFNALQSEIMYVIRVICCILCTGFTGRGLFDVQRGGVHLIHGGDLYPSIYGSLNKGSRCLYSWCQIYSSRVMNIAIIPLLQCKDELFTVICKCTTANADTYIHEAFRNLVIEITYNLIFVFQQGFSAVYDDSGKFKFATISVSWKWYFGQSLSWQLLLRFFLCFKSVRYICNIVHNNSF